jgi:hypothetical protein
MKTLKHRVGRAIVAWPVLAILAAGFAAFHLLLMHFCLRTPSGGSLRLLEAGNGSDVSLACAQALASGLVPLIGVGGSVTTSARLWGRLAPCMDSLVGRVHVYDLPGIDLFPDSGAPLTPWLAKYDQYSSDMYIVHLLKQSDLYTDDPSQALLYLVPSYATHETHYCAFNEHNKTRGVDIITCSETLERGMLRDIMVSVEASPWFQRHNGADHMMVFPWDWGVWLFERNDKVFYKWLVKSSMLLLQYQPIPSGAMPDATTRSLTMPVPSKSFLEPVTVMRNQLLIPRSGLAGGDGSERSFAPGTRACDLTDATLLASFRGTVWPERGYSGGIRQDLLAYYSDPLRSAEDKVVFSAGHTTPELYERELRTSRFCISPPGTSAWSQRIYDLVAAGCPLVFYDSEFKGPPALAFPNIVPWEDFSVTIPVGRHNETAQILRSIPDSVVCAMRKAIVSVAPLLLWNLSPYNVLSLLMVSALGRSQELISNVSLASLADWRYK